MTNTKDRVREILQEASAKTQEKGPIFNITAGGDVTVISQSRITLGPGWEHLTGELRQVWARMDELTACLDSLMETPKHDAREGNSGRE